jgi:hypothetical protein
MIKGLSLSSMRQDVQAESGKPPIIHTLSTPVKMYCQEKRSMEPDWHEFNTNLVEQYQVAAAGALHRAKPQH